MNTKKSIDEAINLYMDSKDALSAVRNGIERLDCGVEKFHVNDIIKEVDGVTEDCREWLPAIDWVPVFNRVKDRVNESTTLWDLLIVAHDVISASPETKLLPISHRRVLLRFADALRSLSYLHGCLPAGDPPELTDGGSGLGIANLSGEQVIDALVDEESQAYRQEIIGIVLGRTGNRG